MHMKVSMSSDMKKSDCFLIGVVFCFFKSNGHLIAEHLILDTSAYNVNVASLSWWGLNEKLDITFISVW